MPSLSPWIVAKAGPSLTLAAGLLALTVSVTHTLAAASGAVSMPGWRW